VELVYIGFHGDDVGLEVEEVLVERVFLVLEVDVTSVDEVLLEVVVVVEVVELSGVEVDVSDEVALVVVVVVVEVVGLSDVELELVNEVELVVVTEAHCPSPIWSSMRVTAPVRA